MYVYCDYEQCEYYKEGLCYNDKIYLDNNGVCMSYRHDFDAKDEEE